MTQVRTPRIYFLLSEIWTMIDSRDLRGVVDLAVDIEKAGIHGVMVGEHVVMGANSATNGVPINPRDWLDEGAQPSKYPHPSSLHLLSAIASCTTTLQLIAGALLTPLRHPLVVAKELATVDLISQGRLTVLPSVSWQREEYEALGVPFEKRGKLLDEQLEIWKRLWRNGSPVSHDSDNFSFHDVYIEPAPWRQSGPPLWFGGTHLSPRLIRRTVRYGTACWPLTRLTAEDVDRLQRAMVESGRSPDELEIGAFLMGKPFRGADDRLDLDETLEPVGELYRRGITSFLLKPSVFIDDPEELGALCRDVVSKVGKLAK